MPDTPTAQGRCTCPPLDDVFAPHVQITTKEPCPVHETPEKLAALADVIVPAIPMDTISIAVFDDPSCDPRHPFLSHLPKEGDHA